MYYCTGVLKGSQYWNIDYSYMWREERESGERETVRKGGRWREGGKEGNEIERVEGREGDGEMERERERGREGEGSCLVLLPIFSSALFLKCCYYV